MDFGNGIKSPTSKSTKESMMFHMNQNLKVVLAVEPSALCKSFGILYAIPCVRLHHAFWTSPLPQYQHSV